MIANRNSVLSADTSILSQQRNPKFFLSEQAGSKENAAIPQVDEKGKQGDDIQVKKTFFVTKIKKIRILGKYVIKPYNPTVNEKTRPPRSRCCPPPVPVPVPEKLPDALMRQAFRKYEEEKFLGDYCYRLPSNPAVNEKNDSNSEKRRFNPDIDYHLIYGVTKHPLTGELETTCDPTPTKEQLNACDLKTRHITRERWIHWGWGRVDEKQFVEHGIQNPGNKSLFICVIQLLSHIPPFAAHIADHRHRCIIKNCIMCAWRSLQFIGKKEVGILEGPMLQLSEICTSASNAIDQDPVECIQKIFDRFSSDYSQIRDFELINDFFSYEKMEETHCYNCIDSSYTDGQFRPILHLTPKPDHGHIQEIIDDFFTLENSPDEECPGFDFRYNCGSKDVEHFRYMIKPPNVLILSIPKTSSPFEKPYHICQNINLGKHAVMRRHDMKGGRFSGNYKLCGYVEHDWTQEEQSSSYYHTKTKKYLETDEWITLNDSEVTPSSADFFGYPCLMAYRRVEDTILDKSSEDWKTKEAFRNGSSMSQDWKKNDDLYQKVSAMFPQSPKFRYW